MKMPSGAVFVALLFSVIGCQAINAQGLYFPPGQGEWERIDPESTGWNADQLEAALDVAGARNSSGVVILLGGRILAERYWELPDAPARYRNYVSGHDASGHAIEDVASAQKSIVAVITGIAQEKGFLSIDDAVSKYLGNGWSEAGVEVENQITILHLLTMTSGLSSDLELQAEAGTTWLYNTPAYHLIMRVVSAATNMDRDKLTREWITGKLAMLDSSWTPRPWASADIGVGFSTTARDLARFGLMIQAGGKWGGQAIVQDVQFIDAMLSPSQALNPAYGYLWWLNGQDFSIQSNPRASRRNGVLIPGAPLDLVAMQGAEDRKLYLVPSLNLVVTRLGFGGAADGEGFNEAFWRALMLAAPETR